MQHPRCFRELAQAIERAERADRRDNDDRKKLRILLFFLSWRDDIRACARFNARANRARIGGHNLISARRRLMDKKRLVRLARVTSLRASYSNYQHTESGGPPIVLGVRRGGKRGSCEKQHGYRNKRLRVLYRQKICTEAVVCRGK